MMLRIGTRLTNDKKNIDLLVCHVSCCRRFTALYDLNGFDPKKNLSKPEAWRMDDVLAHITSHSLKVERFDYPVVMTRSDDWIATEMGKGAWLDKRDYKFRKIESLVSPDKIEQYLYGKGLAAEIKPLLGKDKWKGKASFHSAINRYIIFGCTKNSLLPFGLMQCGSNYRYVKDLSDSQIKRGPNGKNGKVKVRSNARCVNDVDKLNIKKTAAFIKSNHVNFSIAFAYRLYHRTFERYVIERETTLGTQRIFNPFPEEDRISDGMFRYHFKKIIDKASLLRLKHGDVNFAKDFEDRQGKSFDGVLGATQRYEVDATILDCYVRYPFDTSKRYSMGRPVLYLVVDVYSTMIVGMYLGFDGPNWQGVSQALANACLDKVEFAKRFGVLLDENDWPAKHVPIELAIDNGPEYRKTFIDALLNARIGIEDVAFMAIYRGDAKGVVERKFGTVNDQVIKFVPGALADLAKREDSHASNNALYDYDSLMQVLIAEICYHNNSADRLKRLNFKGLANGADFTPKAIFLNSLEDMEKVGRLNPEVSEAKIRWAFLPEERATVTSSSIRFEGVEYHHPYFKSSGGYARARHHGTFNILVKRMYDNINELLHETDDGQIVKLRLKNINNENPLASQHWEQVMHLMEQEKDMLHEHKQNALITRSYWDSVTDLTTAQQEAERSLAPKNKHKSIQPGIKARQQIHKLVLRAQANQQLDNTFGTGTDLESMKPAVMDDLDDELYGD